MTGEQAVGYLLNSISALTTMMTGTSGTRIYHGTRPVGSVVPCINYFEMAGGIRQNGFEKVTYSINCRATTAGTALQIARLVGDLFHGTSSTGIYGYTGASSGTALGNFEITRASVRQSQGLIPETADNIYNAPVDVFIVYPSSSIS